MTPVFPLCSASAHEAALRDLVDACVGFVRERLSPPTLLGIVLTGSFARGEGSVLPLGGRLKVLGDIEFFVVLARDADYRRLVVEMSGWGRQAAALGGDRVDVDLEFGPVNIGYLRRARPSIFVYDLRHHGKVLWGPPDLLHAIAPFTADAVPPEDAVRLLFNRTIEQLDAYDRVADGDGEELVDAAYRRLKIVLDLAGSALAFAGVHSASYARRPAALARLVAETPSLARRLPAGFERRVEHAARVKLAPREEEFAPEGATVEAQRAALRAEIVADVPAVTGLLSWQLEQLTGAQGDLPTLLERYTRLPALARRALESAKLLRNPLRPPVPYGALAWPRLLGSTPRALLYAAAALAYTDLGSPRPDPGAVARFLPLAGRARPLDPRAQRRAIVALWRWCVRNS